MEKIATMVKRRKPLSFQASQLLYGVSVVLTFLAAGRLGALV